MGETLIEPDVEAALHTYFRGQFAALGIGTQSVSARVEDGLHLRIVATGGSGDTAIVIFGQQVTFEAHGSTLQATSKLMRETAAVFRSIAHTTQGGVLFYGIRSMGAGVNGVDPVTKRARYSRTSSIDVRLLPL